MARSVLAGGDRLHPLLRHRHGVRWSCRGDGLPLRPVQHRLRRPGLFCRPGRRGGVSGISTPCRFWLIVPIAIVVSMVFGAAWAAIPAWLQARRGSHIVITTIMFNFIAYALMNYVLVHVLIKPGQMSPESRTFAEQYDATAVFMHEILAPHRHRHHRDTPLNATVFLGRSPAWCSCSGFSSGTPAGVMRSASSAPILRRRSMAASRTGADE